MNHFTVFTKPWPDKSLDELGVMVKNMGFDGVELPVRPGFQVTPETVRKRLPEAKKVLEDHGVKIGSVAGGTDEATIAACGEAGIPVIRVMVNIDMNIGYFATERKVRKEYDALIPLLEKHGVTIGVQNHCGTMVGSSLGLMRLIEDYDPGHVGAVLDLAHCGLVGEPDVMAIDIAWSHLALVNLKSAYWVRESGPEVQDAAWHHYWTLGGYGITNWKASIDDLKKRKFKGDICLSAEYSHPEKNDSCKGRLAGEYVVKDLRYARSLFDS